MYLSAVCVCMALCFVGCSKDDDEPGGKGAMYEVTIEQSGDFRSFIKSVVVVANGTQLKDGATGESLASPVILSDEELAVEKGDVKHDGKGDRVCRFRWCRGRRGRRCERADAVGSDRLQKRKGDREKEPCFPGREGDKYG